MAVFLASVPGYCEGLWWVARSSKKGWPLGVAQGNSPDEAAQRLLQRYQLRQQQENRNKQPRRKRTGYWVDRSRLAPQAAGY